MMFAAVLLSSGAWVWLLAGHGGFWRSGPVLEPAKPGGDSGRGLRVCAVIPARNEAEHLEEAVRSLLQQAFAGEIRVVLVDDNSTDATGQIGQRIAAEDERMRVLQGEPLLQGWTGKMWAVSQGLAQPEAAAADYVLLTDADIVHGPGHVAALVAQAERGGLGMVSEMVRLRCETWAERATLPAFVFFFGMLYPFARVNDPRSGVAAAAGGTMLLSREALERVEGVSRIRAALIDDVALAQEVKREGFPIWLGHGTEVWSRRTYADFGDAWEMIARTAYVQLRYSPSMLLGTCAGMVLLYGVPVAAALRGRRSARWMGAACWAGMALAFQPTLRRYRRSPLWGLALPVIGLFYLGATVDSAVRSYRGNGGRWKDRTYAVQG